MLHHIDGTSEVLAPEEGKVTQTLANEELRTVGVAGTKKGDITENQIRKENRQNKRGAY